MKIDFVGNKQLPNGIKEQYNYDDMGRLVSIAYVGCEGYFQKRKKY